MSGAIQKKSYPQRRACRLAGLKLKTYRCALTRQDDGVLQQRLKELASERRRFYEYFFASLSDARRIIEEWRTDHNTLRPHSSLKGLTPKDFAAALLGRDQKRLSLKKGHYREQVRIRIGNMARIVPQKTLPTRY